jgi:6,7-dimethyl-8-ribityllumazine synthase
MSEPSWPGGGRSYDDLGLSPEEPALPVQEERAPDAPASAEATRPDPVELEATQLEAPPEAAAAASEPVVAEPAVAEPVVAEPAVAEVPQHAAGEIDLPAGVGILEGAPDGTRRAVGVVVARFNGEITGRMLAVAMEELDRCGVLRSAVTVMPVPGAYELPLAAMALAKTRRFACIVALGCVIRGETAHFDFVAGEAASGLQLAALETGVPVAFGVLTTETREQAEARIGRAADSVRGALEMADAFAKLRTAVSA